MAICLDYQVVSYRRVNSVSTLTYQLLAVGALLCALVFKIWIKSQITDVGYELAREKTVMVELDMRKRELDLERSFLIRRDQLEDEARTRLGLTQISPKQARKIIY